ncbi:MAG: hypothetical protein H8E05_01205 [Bacteroidetes bacterium]|nr:hypothetical protein [Bacteroidota bacterium]
MNSDILKNYLSVNSIDSSSLKVNYSFEEINNGIVHNELHSGSAHYPEAGCLDAGVLPGIPVNCVVNPDFENFKSCCSMGYFDSDTILRIGEKFEQTEWTIFVNYNNNVIRDDRDKSEVLVSSMSSPTGISGFNMGINGANRMYFEYVNTDGILKNLILPREVELYNLVSVSKSESNIVISNHDPFSRRNYIQPYEALDFVDSHIWTIGGFYETGNYERYRGFKGFIDDYIAFDMSFSTTQTNLISEALYYTGVKEAYQIQTTRTVETITGAPTMVSVPTESGITGYNLVPLSTVNTACGTPVNVCIQEPMYGPGTKEVLDFARVNVDIVDVEYVPEEKLYNETYTSNYGEKNIVFLKDIDLKDVYEIYSQSGFNSNLNHTGLYDPAYESFAINDSHVGKKINAFINGVQSSPTGDYSLSQNLVSSGSGFIFESTDTLSYDVISSDPIYYEYDGTTYPEVNLVGGEYLNKDIYFNGQKMISGLNYQEFHAETSGVTIFPIEESITQGVSGEYVLVEPSEMRSISYTGTIEAFDSLSFNLRNEQVWLNGYRQIEGLDYVKTSDKSLLNSDLRLETKSNIIYNNDGNFFNVSA